MINFSVPWGHVAAFAVFKFLMSWIWFALFGKPWARALGIDMSKDMNEAEKRKMLGYFGGSILASLILAYGLQILVQSLGAQDFARGAMVGVTLWLAFSVSGILDRRCEGQPDIVHLFNAGYRLVTYVLIAGMAGVWH